MSREWTFKEDTYIIEHFVSEDDAQMGVALDRTAFDIGRRRRHLGFDRNAFRSHKFVSNQRMPYDPSPEQIKQRCEEIRAGWSHDTHLVRMGLSREKVHTLRRFVTKGTHNGRYFYEQEAG